MMEKTTKELLNDLEKVLNFSSEMIVWNLKGEKRDDESSIESIKESCKRLNENGVFSFDVDCSNQELLQQIQEFATRVDGDSHQGAKILAP